MTDLNGWWLDKTKLRCQNVLVYNMDMYWFVMVDGKTLEDFDAYNAEDAVKEAEKYIVLE